MKTRDQQNRIWPLLLLMAAIVILPTVCLLWFMTQAVRNERLAVKQKLIEICQTQCDEINQQMNEKLEPYLQRIYSSEAQSLPLFLGQWVEHETRQEYPSIMPMVARGIVPYRNSNQQLFPIDSQTPVPKTPSENTDKKNQLLTHTQLREQLHCRLYEVDIQLKKPQPDVTQLNKNIIDANNYMAIDCPSTDPLWQQTLPADLWAFFLEKTIKQYEHVNQSQKVRDIGYLKSFLRNTNTSLAIAERYLYRNELPKNIHISFQPLDEQNNIYGMLLKSPHHSQTDQLVLYSKDMLNAHISVIDDSLTRQVTLILLDPQNLIFTANTSADNTLLLLTRRLKGYLSGWQIRLYLKDSRIFEQASSRQTTIYIWTAALVIILIVLAAAFAVRSLSHQIKLNKLKNDFLATVSHELKTPLSSMRLLVDTLIEGNVKDDTQQRDYLDMIAKENSRLSRLIDNFLTFSRMERNKQSLDFRPANPVQIAYDAAAAVKTTYENNHCQLDLDIAEPLPEIYADYDALVTVLVNLLDNACKYSQVEQKQVSLKAIQLDHCICFEVADNGIGIAKRNLKKIFDRFYQVDQTLARSSSGAGLGLSIVKFILDAHHATVNVESKSDTGSTFTVTIPLEKNNRL